MKFACTLMLFALTAITVSGQSQSPIPGIIDRVNAYYSDNPGYMTFIETDKHFYSSGDILWFSGYLVSKKGSNEKLSLPVTVRLSNAKGELVMSDRYLIDGNTLHGDLMIPEELAEGKYFLSAMPDNQEDIDQTCIHPVEIRNFDTNSILFSLKPDKETWQNGDSGKIHVRARNPYDKPVKKKNLTYRIKSGEKLVLEEQIKTDDKGEATIALTINNEHLNNQLFFEVEETKSKSIATIELPIASDSLQIKFYPEGGNLIAGMATKIGFHVVDEYGKELDMEGQIIDNEGNAVSLAKTSMPGFGMIAINPQENKRYWLQTETGKKYALPEVKSDGCAFSISKTEGHDYRAIISFADKMKHPVALILSRGGTVFWAADAIINDRGTINIPTKGVPEGLGLISLFSDKEELLAERLVHIQGENLTDLNIIQISNNNKTEEEIQLQIQISTKGNEKRNARVHISVCDTVWNNVTPGLPWAMNYNAMLENKLNTINRSSSFSPRFFDFLLIANKQKWHQWEKVLQTPPMTGQQLTKAINRQKQENNLKNTIRILNRKSGIDEEMIIPDGYFSSNSKLLKQRKSGKQSISTASNSYKTLLETGTNMMEVLKAIKPYSLMGNKIVFPGTMNSLKAQGGALIVIDGQQTGEDSSVLNGINPYDVESINVSTQAMDIQRYTGFNSVGVIEITTKKGIMRAGDNGAKKYSPAFQGEYRLAENFSSVVSALPHEKTTLWWTGRTELNSSAPFILNIPRSSVQSGFMVIVEGIDDQGDPVSGYQYLRK